MAGPGAGQDPQVDEAGGPVVRDRRRLDPETYEVRSATATGAAAAAAYAAAARATDPSAGGVDAPAGADGHEGPDGAGPHGADDDGAAEVTAGSPADGTAIELAAATARVEELVTDLQRLQAEYVNYRRRVDRDRDVARELAVAGVLESLLPVLDDVHLARQHGDLGTGPFAAIAEKLESTLTRYGLERYGEVGELFDPTIHEALIHTRAELAEGTTDTTVVQILQPGYRIKDRILRAARVAVADPE